MPFFEVRPAPRRYAVLLNARAKAWTGTIHQEVLKYIPAKDLFLTDDFRQAQQTVEKLLGGQYDAIFTGGGDGTIVYLINAIEKFIQSGKIQRKDAPPVGVLRLGTGNAIASYVGAGPILDDLRALRAGAPLKVQYVNMISDDSRLFPFAGFGWDADILNDYEDLKKSVRDTAFENYVTGMGGYALSVALRTIPKAARRKSTDMRFTNLGDIAYQLDANGQVLRQFKKGDILYEGPVKITSSASIPYWGFKIRMFPYTNLKPGFFELRCYFGNIPYVVANLDKFWTGDMSHDYMCDFLVTEVDMQVLGEPMAYQVAGDAEGNRQDVQWRSTQYPVPLAVPHK